MNKKFIKDLRSALTPMKILKVILGNMIYCVGLVGFILPLDMITGGTTGIGIIMNHYFHIPIDAFALIFNVTMFIVAWFVLGVSFALTTLVSTFTFPIILGFFQRTNIIPIMTEDMMLATICAGLCIGIGIGIVMREGASTGGMDIPPLVCKKKFGLSVSMGLYLFDSVILIGQMMFRDSEKILYGILLVIVYTIMLDKVLLMGKSKVEVQIISDFYEEINAAIQRKIDRGTTFFVVETGYLRKDTKALMTVVSNRELVKLHQIVQDIDPKAFVVIHQAKEVMGKGFSMKKIYEFPE